MHCNEGLLERRALRLSTLKKISLYLERDFSRNFGGYVILSLGSLTNVLPLCIQMRPLCCPLSGAQWPSDQAAQWFSMAQLRRNSGKVLSTPSKVVAEKKSDVGTSGRAKKVPSSTPGSGKVSDEAERDRKLPKKVFFPFMQVGIFVSILRNAADYSNEHFVVRCFTFWWFAVRSFVIWSLAVRCFTFWCFANCHFYTIRSFHL